MYNYIDLGKSSRLCPTGEAELSHESQGPSTRNLSRVLWRKATESAATPSPNPWIRC